MEMGLKSVATAVPQERLIDVIQNKNVKTQEIKGKVDTSSQPPAVASNELNNVVTLNSIKPVVPANLAEIKSDRPIKIQANESKKELSDSEQLFIDELLKQSQSVSEIKPPLPDIRQMLEAAFDAGKKSASEFEAKIMQEAADFNRAMETITRANTAFQDALKLSTPDVQTDTTVGADTIKAALEVFDGGSITA